VSLACTSSPLAKGDPVLGISGLDPHILAFSTPENAPAEISLGLKKKLGEKKKGHKNHPKKKVRALPFVLARWRQKKKSGLSRRKLPRLFWIVPLVGPFRPAIQRNITRFQVRRVPFRLMFFFGVIFDPGQSSPDVGTL
jgi:hypothetical protein